MSKQTIEFVPQFGDARRVEAIARPRPIGLADYQTGLAQYLEVLRHGRLGERYDVYDLAANARAALRQCAQDGDPGRMAQGLCPHSKPLI